MKTLIAGSNGMAGATVTRRLTARKVLLVCGVLAPLYYVVVNDVVAAMRYPGYDRISRPVSELSATYAPSRSVLVPLLVIFELMMIAFWISVWRSAQNNRALRITTGLMMGFAVLGLLAFPFAMKTNEVLGANTIHTIIWGVITPLLMLTGIGVSAAAFEKRFRLYAILTLVALVAFSAWSGIVAAQVEAGGNLALVRDRGARAHRDVATVGGRAGHHSLARPSRTSPRRPCEKEEPMSISAGP